MLVSEGARDRVFLRIRFGEAGAVLQKIEDE